MEARESITSINRVSLRDNRAERILRATAGCAFALAALSAVGCMDFADKKSTGDGSSANPWVLTRDNVALGGEIAVNGTGYKGVVGNDKKFLSDARWVNGGGYARVVEYRSDSTWFASYTTPLLPRADYQSPGNAKYGVRAIPMVHGNKYEVISHGMPDGQSNQSIGPQYVKLSDDTMIVPVVVVSWVPSGQTFDASTDQRLSTAGSLDFLPSLTGYSGIVRPTDTGGWMTPYRLLTATINQTDITSSNFTNGSASLAKYRPDARWTPPDEIFAKAGVQFQVIDSIRATLPSNWSTSFHCSKAGRNTPSGGSALINKYLGTAREGWARYVAGNVKPVYVNFAPFHCDEWHGVTGGNNVDIEEDAPANVLAHELGHTVLGPTHSSSTTSIMHASFSGTDLTDAECTSAHTGALPYSAAFDELNRVTGRTYSPTPIPADLGKLATSSTDTGTITFTPPTTICCSAFPSGVMVSPAECTAAGGTEVSCPPPIIPK